ncbi:jg13883 [Pararge aegeria aegeria]|uniref:Jg13883 protein n=1 Tax=Pararge aegeria aegeria TaxID=348720 RepID=A0A8S4SAR7_9NEOP|nr:jg13883 [Pararge aegeria aegeria]
MSPEFLDHVYPPNQEPQSNHVLMLHLILYPPFKCTSSDRIEFLVSHLFEFLIPSSTYIRAYSLSIHSYNKHDSGLVVDSARIAVLAFREQSLAVAAGMANQTRIEMLWPQEPSPSCPPNDCSPRTCCGRVPDAYILTLNAFEKQGNACISNA